MQQQQRRAEPLEGSTRELWLFLSTATVVEIIEGKVGSLMRGLICYEMCFGGEAFRLRNENARLRTAVNNSPTGNCLSATPYEKCITQNLPGSCWGSAWAETGAS